ncbi:MAG: hypothetical protein LCI00_02170 [Chloroflexi bacterium]|nr:hypothetical protein [Chloroflexota bacterium]
MADKTTLARLAVRQRNCRANLKRKLAEGAPAKSIAYYTNAVKKAEAEYRAYRAEYFKC